MTAHLARMSSPLASAPAKKELGFVEFVCLIALMMALNALAIDSSLAFKFRTDNSELVMSITGKPCPAQMVGVASVLFAVVLQIELNGS